MVSAGVSWNGKTEIFFIDPQKTKVNQKTYIDFVKTSLLPECRRLYPDNDFVFMQDSAPSHLAKATRNFLRDNTPNFRWKSEHSRSVWLQSLRSMHRFVDQKRNDYWRSKTDSQASARELWWSIDAILYRDSPNAAKPSRMANDFADFFESKVASIRTATDGASPPTFRDVQSQSSLHLFTPLSCDDVIKLVCSAPAKQSSLDPTPTWLLIDCIDLLSP